MNILVISQFYPPDLGAVAFRMEAIVNEMRTKGHNVYVLSATPNRYKDFHVELNHKNREYEIRLDLKNSSRSIISRVKGFFEFYYKCIRKKNYYKDKCIDVVISTTPYMLEGLAGQIIAKSLNAKHLLDVRDLWPDTPIALGKIRSKGPIAFGLRLIEKRLYRRANKIISTSPGYISHINAVAPNQKVEVILNGIDSQFEEDINIYKKTFNRANTDKVIITYAGNIGVAQNLVTLVKSAIDLKNHNFHFRLIGSGTQIKEIKELIEDNHLNNVEIIPPVKRDELFKYYMETDILYLQLHSSKYFSKVVPSKIFEYLLVQKPIIYGLNGVSVDILVQFGDTYYVKPDNSNELTEVIKIVDTKKNINRDYSTLRRSIQINKYSNIIENLLEDL